MSTSVGLWCVEHEAGHWESGVRSPESMAWAWRNREALLTFGAMLDEPGDGWEIVGVGGSPVPFEVAQFLQQHRGCTVRHYNEYHDIGDVLLDESPPCASIHPGHTNLACQLPDGHTCPHDHRSSGARGDTTHYTWLRGS